MKRAALVLAVAGLVAAPATVFAAELFGATLSAGQEVPAPTVPADYAGTGTASVTINDDATAAEFNVSFEGLTGDGTALMAHIHYAPPGEAGPVMLWLTEHGVTDGTYASPLTGTLMEEHFSPVEDGPQTFAEALDAIRNGSAYVNIHTTANPSGELRGDLAVVPDTATAAEATGLVRGPGVIALVLALIGAVALAVSFRRIWTQRI
jgi:trimeric autotransporter adhesin